MPDSDLRRRREATVRAHIEAENRHDVPATIATFAHPQYDVAPGDLFFDGPAEIDRLLSSLMRGFSDFHIIVHNLRHADDAVICEITMTGTHDGFWSGLQPTGRRATFRAAAFFLFDADRLLRETIHFDMDTILRQLGAAGRP